MRTPPIPPSSAPPPLLLTSASTSVRLQDCLPGLTTLRKKLLDCRTHPHTWCTAAMAFICVSRALFMPHAFTDLSAGQSRLTCLGSNVDADLQP